MENGVYGDLIIIIYPDPYSIYLRGTISYLACIDFLEGGRFKEVLLLKGVPGSGSLEASVD